MSENIEIEQSILANPGFADCVDGEVSRDI